MTTNQDPTSKEFLRAHGIARCAVLNAMDRFPLSHRGLCNAFQTEGITTVLAALGGRPKFPYWGERRLGYWDDPMGDNWFRAENERMMMLAFLLEWTK